MTESLRVVVADDEPDVREYFAETLAELGHSVLAAAATGDELLAACRRHAPDLIVTDVRMPGGDGLSIARAYAAERFTPTIVVTAYHDQATLAEASEPHVFSYLVKPIERPQLEAALAIAWLRYRQFSSLRGEADSLRQALEDRKLIERAKGLLMLQAGVSEDEAFRRLQKTARNQNKKLSEVASALITAAKVIGA